MRVGDRKNAWQCLDNIWQGSQEVIDIGLPHAQLAPPWQILLLGDGSPTKQKSLYNCT